MAEIKCDASNSTNMSTDCGCDNSTPIKELVSRHAFSTCRHQWPRLRHDQREKAFFGRNGAWNESRVFFFFFFFKVGCSWAEEKVY